MTENYEQIINIAQTKKQRILKIISLVFGLITLAFAIPAGLVDVLFVIGTVINIILAFITNQFYLGSIVKYIIEINGTRYTISETNRFGKTSKIMDIPLDDIIDFIIVKARDIDTINFDFDQINSLFKEQPIPLDEIKGKNVYKYLDKENIVDTMDLTIIRHKYDESIVLIILPLDDYAEALLEENINKRAKK